jgi:hypothetical protein
MDKLIPLKERQRLRAIEGNLATTEYRAVEASIGEKMARLKALRLARDARPVIIASAPKAKKPRGKRIKDAPL